MTENLSFKRPGLDNLKYPEKAWPENLNSLNLISGMILYLASDKSLPALVLANKRFRILS